MNGNGVAMKFDYSKTLNEQLPTFEYYKDRYCSYELQILELQQENQQLKMIIEEYERINKENGRGFTITSVKQYNIDELVRYTDNWKKLKKFLETNWKETQDIWFVKIINKMRDIERGVRDVED